MQIKTVEEHVEEAMKVFRTKKELRSFLGDTKSIHHNTLQAYIDDNWMPYDIRKKMINETKRRLKLLSN